MTIPIAAPVIDEPVDPADVRPFWIPITRPGGTDPFPMLETGEDVASFTLSPSAEAVAAGLQIKTGTGYDPVLASDLVKFYPIVSAGNQLAAQFSDAGLILGVELTITTNATPPNTVQRTVGLIVRQR